MLLESLEFDMAPKIIFRWVLNLASFILLYTKIAAEQHVTSRARTLVTLLMEQPRS